MRQRFLGTPTLVCMLSLSILMARLSQAGDTSLPGTKNSEVTGPYQVDWALDAGLTTGALVVFVMPRLLFGTSVDPFCTLDCDANDLNELDQLVVGKHSETAALVSDMGVATAIVGPFVLTALDGLLLRTQKTRLGYARDIMVFTETLVLTWSVHSLCNFAIRRPRPYVYDTALSNQDRLRKDRAMSFPSGHTASAFAMATAYSYTFSQRYPNSDWVFPVWLTSYALASLTGVMRVEAGKHFWTDVIAGAALGAGMGLLVPYLHRLRDEAQTSKKSFSISPLVLPNGFGASVTIQ